MDNIKITISKLKQNKDYIKKLGVAKIGFFGSWVRNEQKENSDLDILVEFINGQKTYKHYIELYDFLEDLYKTRIDLLTPEALSPLIKPYIDKEIIYERIN
jgi:uncharacterized protein